MASVNQSTNVLPSVAHSSLGGNASAYQEKIMGGAKRKSGGQGYGFEGKSIAPGVAEVSSYKGGSDMQRKSKRRQSKRRQNKSRRQRKSRR
jgi:hypothetical protein